MPDWQATSLWSKLQASSHPESGHIAALLRPLMTKIQRVLASGGTSATDLTLHDTDHSFRVAEWMAKIVPAQGLPRFNVYELGVRPSGGKSRAWTGWQRPGEEVFESTGIPTDWE